ADTVRRGRYLPLLAPTVGAGLLVYDLHTPQRFYNMFRVAKGTSPMSIGTWILTSFSLFSGLAAGLQFVADRVPGWLAPRRPARWPVDGVRRRRWGPRGWASRCRWRSTCWAR